MMGLMRPGHECRALLHIAIAGNYAQGFLTRTRFCVGVNSLNINDLKQNQTVSLYSSYICAKYLAI